MALTAGMIETVESDLRQNFKSYGAWHHRKWVLSKGHSSLGQELRLLDKLQQLDSRNFHVWKYRRFLAALLNRSVEDQLMHTKVMIGINISNYSAWPNRSMLLRENLKEKGTGLTSKVVLIKEYELVQNAIFTDPDFQSVIKEALGVPDSGGHNPEMISWKDPHFCPGEVDPRVLNSTVSFGGEIEENKDSTASESQKEIFLEIAGFRDLLAIEDYKIGKLLLARLLMAGDALSYPYGNRSVHSTEVLQLLRDLVKSDPTHSRYYEDKISLVLLQQLTPAS